ncbi:MAG: hypothetical protein AAGK25_06480 [Pseudomonadota bacterium]
MGSVLKQVRLRIEILFFGFFIVTLFLVLAIAWLSAPDLWAAFYSGDSAARVQAVGTLSTIITAFAIVGTVLTAFIAYRASTKEYSSLGTAMM